MSPPNFIFGCFRKGAFKICSLQRGRGEFADIHLDAGFKRFLGGPQQLPGDLLINVSFTAVIADSCGNTLDHQRSATAFKRDGGLASSSLAVLADHAFHCALPSRSLVPSGLDPVHKRLLLLSHHLSRFRRQPRESAAVHTIPAGADWGTESLQGGSRFLCL